MAKWEESEEEEDLEGVVWVEDWLGGFEGLADFKEVLIFTRILRACERENGLQMWANMGKSLPRLVFFLFFFSPFWGMGL